MFKPRRDAVNAHDPLYHHRQCATKFRYDTKREAKSAARDTTSKVGKPMSAYECPCCGGWHVTKLHKEARRTARAAAEREALRLQRRNVS